MLFFLGERVKWGGHLKQLCKNIFKKKPPSVLQCQYHYLHQLFDFIVFYVFIYLYCEPTVKKWFICSDTKHFKNTLISYVISFLFVFVHQKRTTFTTSTFPIFHICKAIPRAGSKPLAGHFCPTLHLFDSRALNDSCINNEKQMQCALLLIGRCKQINSCGLTSEISLGLRLQGHFQHVIAALYLSARLSCTHSYIITVLRHSLIYTQGSIH